MKNMTFGYLLEQLIHLSKQKKSILAKELGYDVSYISKWTSGKNLPIHKNINYICETIAKFIVRSITLDSVNDIKSYFGITIDMDNKSLEEYLELLLKDSYVYTTQKSIPTLPKENHWQEDNNSIMHINPKLRKQYLTKDIESFMSKSNKLNLILSTNLNRLNDDGKREIADIKPELFKIKNDIDIKVKILFGFEDKDDDIIFNTILIINMIAMHPSMNFEVYNCTVDSNAIISIIKDSTVHMATFTRNKRCLLTNTSKDKNVIDELYYSLETILKNQGSPIVEKKSLIDIIKEKIYTQYIMAQDLRWLIGSINELFMPSDLFIEVAESVFDDEEILGELKKINLFLQNITYKSKLKVLIYESEIKRYISCGCINFFNTPIELNFDQRKRHINFIKKIISDSKMVEINLIEGDFVEYFKNYKNPSLYLSKNIKLIQTDHEDGISDYAIIKDNKFRSICDEFYNSIWENKKDIIVSDKEEILEMLEKDITYASIINESF